MRRGLVIAIAATSGALTSTLRVEPFHTEARHWNGVAGRVSAAGLASDIHRAVGVWPDSVARCGPTRLYIFFADPPFGRHGRPTIAEQMVDSIAYRYTGRAAEAAWVRDRAANVNDTIFVDLMAPGAHQFWPEVEAGYHFAEGTRPLVSRMLPCAFIRDSTTR